MNKIPKRMVESKYLKVNEMDNETTLVRVRCVFTEKQRTAINMYFKKNEQYLELDSSCGE